MKKKAWFLFVCIVLLFGLEFVPYCYTYGIGAGPGETIKKTVSYFLCPLPERVLSPVFELTVPMVILALLHGFFPKKRLRLSIFILGLLAYPAAVCLQCDSRAFQPLGWIVAIGLLGVTLFAGFGFSKKASLKESWVEKKKSCFLFGITILLLVLEFLPYSYNYRLPWDIPWVSYFASPRPEKFIFPIGEITILMAVLALLHIFYPKRWLRISIFTLGIVLYPLNMYLQLFTCAKLAPLGLIITAGLLGAALFAGLGFRNKQPE